MSHSNRAAEGAAVLTCSGHHWEFDPRTGKGINPSECRLCSFPVQIEGEAIRVGIPQDGSGTTTGAPRADPPGRQFNRRAGHP